MHACCGQSKNMAIQFKNAHEVKAHTGFSGRNDMLCELAIRNFAIIDDARLSFSDGMTVMTGETGAGKSIIIQAVNLVLGSRADARMIRQGQEYAEVEAFFTPGTDTPTARRMLAKDLDPGEGLHIRRVLNINGGNRIYINGRMATVQLLGELTDQLASIAGQHAHQRLLDENLHLDILDLYAGLSEEKQHYRETYAALEQLVHELEKLKRQKIREEKEADFIAFQIREISEASPCVGEDLALEQQRKKLRHARALTQSLGNLLHLLYDGEDNLWGRIGHIRKELEKNTTLDPSLSGALKNTENLALGTEELVEDLRHYLDRLDPDPAALEKIEERLHLLEKLKKKYGGNLATVLQHKDSLEERDREVQSMDENIAHIEKKLVEDHEKLVACAQNLSKKRNDAAEKMAEEVEKELSDLCMTGTRFRILLVPLAKTGTPWLSDGERGLNEKGLETARFCIAPNLGESEHPLAKIASGGELSRTVLALKSILSRNDAVGTIIFDEADAGIGGSVAEAVGKKMQALATRQQVICITHLPQIAKFGKHHLRIEKIVDGGRTRTHIQSLAEPERPEEIARMLGGAAISETTLAHARELLKEARA